MTGKRIVRERLPIVDGRSVIRTRPVDAGRGNPHALARAHVGDTLYNLATGMGTSKDKTTQTMFGSAILPKAQLDAAYRTDWISRKVVDIPAFDAVREWRTWQGDASDITKIEETEKKIRIRRKAMQGLIRARLYGGGALVIGVDDGFDPKEPMDIEKLKQDCLKWVHPVSRYELTAGPIDWNLNSPFFGTPAYYTRSLQMSVATAVDPKVMKEQAQMNARVQAGGMITIHPSRIVRFTGMETPEWNMSDGGWGDSVLGVVADAVLSLGTVNQALAALVNEAKQDIIRIPELSERISDKEYEGLLTERFATANLMKSLFSVLLLDREEEWQRIEQTFTGIPEVMQQFMMMVCGAADIPSTRFMSESPKGMNATGDSDTRNYYDRVSTVQELDYTPAMEELDRIIVISALGKFPDGMFYDWNPLWQMDEAQKAEIAVKQATVMTADVNAGLLDPVVIQKARENQLIESGFYPGIEQIIDEYGTNIDEREPLPGQGETELIDPETGEAPDPNDPEAMARAKPQPKAPAPFGQKPANENEPPVPPKKTGTQDAISAMAQRIRDSITDATTPRTLYVWRPVQNFADIAKHYKDQGVENVITSEQQVTIAYSRTPVDWLKIGSEPWGQDDEGRMIIRPGGPRVMEKFGHHLVLAFAASDLSYRHCSILERTGGSWDYDDYTPHVSISKDPGAIDIMGLKPWTGPIILGPEQFEEVKPEYFNGDPPKMTDSMAMIVDAIRNMPPPQVHVSVKNGRVVKEETTFHHDASGRVSGATKTITENAED